MRVVICGTGIGGLTLAHGLRQFAVVVVDSDARARDAGGYRIHMDAQACAVLTQVLPSPTWEAIGGRIGAWRAGALR